MCDAILTCCVALQHDLSLAGARRGLEGERSGLFFEIMRIATEVLPKPPRFLFLENVLGIRSSGLLRVLECLASVRYDVRWCVVSASSVGAHHQRQRWFALCRLCPEEDDVAHAKGFHGGDDAGRSIHQPQHCTDFEQVRRLACWSEKDAEVFVREPQVPRVVSSLTSCAHLDYMQQSHNDRVCTCRLMGVRAGNWTSCSGATEPWETLSAPLKPSTPSASSAASCLILDPSLLSADPEAQRGSPSPSSGPNASLKGSPERSQSPGPSPSQSPNPRPRKRAKSQSVPEKQLESEQDLNRTQFQPDPLPAQPVPRAQADTTQGPELRRSSRLREAARRE